LKLATLISAGFSPAEAGAVFGLSKKSVNTAMTALREEIRAQQKN
jgi:DNA-directed RNA polymerase specialized sigma24 family protein